MEQQLLYMLSAVLLGKLFTAEDQQVIDSLIKEHKAEQEADKIKRESHSKLETQLKTVMFLLDKVR